MRKILKDKIAKHIEGIKSIEKNALSIEGAIDIIYDSLLNDGTVFLCGNGGSAADAQHIAAEFTGRFKKERKGLPAIAITTDTSAITAIGNDYGFDFIYSRQIEALAQPNDVVIGISTSGNSQNVINAIIRSKEKGIKTIGLLGRNGGKIKDLCSVPIVVEIEDTATIQEIHIFIGHLICEIIENRFIS